MGHQLLIRIVLMIFGLFEATDAEWTITAALIIPLYILFSLGRFSRSLLCYSINAFSAELAYNLSINMVVI